MTDPADASPPPARWGFQWTPDRERRAFASVLTLAALVAAGALVAIALQLGQIERGIYNLPSEAALDRVTDSVGDVGKTLNKMEAKQAEPVVRASAPWYASPSQDPVAAAIDRQTRAQEAEAARQRRIDLLGSMGR